MTQKSVHNKLLVVFLCLTACRDGVPVSGKGERRGGEQTITDHSKVVVERKGATGEPDLPEVPGLPQVNSSLTPESAAQLICNFAPGSSERQSGIDFFKAYKPGTREYNNKEAAKSRKNCVDFLLPSALYVNLISGVPAGTLIGQAIQETGGCTSDLAHHAFNFHGQKATLAASHFTHWNPPAHYTKSSSESATGVGQNEVSNFMKFKHADFSFYSVSERFIHPGLPDTTYKACMSLRDKPAEFIHCIGKSWARHAVYAEEVLRHRKDHNLERCELKKSEWELAPKFKL